MKPCVTTAEEGAAVFKVDAASGSCDLVLSKRRGRVPAEVASVKQHNKQACSASGDVLHSHCCVHGMLSEAFLMNAREGGC